MNFLLRPDAPGSQATKMTPEQKEALAEEAADRARKTMRERFEAVGGRPFPLDEVEEWVEQVGREADQ